MFLCSVCEETHRASSGTVQSPGGAGGSKQCTYIVEQWTGYVVRLRFDRFSLGDGSDDCRNTYLEVGETRLELSSSPCQGPCVWGEVCLPWG